MKKNLFGKKGALLIALIMAATLLLTSCGPKTSSESQSSESQSSSASQSQEESQSTEDEVKEPADITWMSILHTDSPPSDEVIQAINELANVNLTFNWIPDANKAEKLNAALASKNLADIVTLTQLENATIRGALSAGMFWDVEEYLKDYPNLASIPEGRLDTIRVDGKVYGVPIVKPVARYGVVIRQDWLDNLNLPVPTTFEELMDVAIAFTNDDPDGDGQNNTYGIVDREESFNLGFRMISGWYGASCFFGLSEDGTVQPWFMDEGYFKAMENYRTLYEAGAINSDFAIMAKKDQQQAIAQSKGGIVITGLMDTKNYVQLAKDIDMEGEMVWTQINDMHAEGVDRRILSDTGNGVGGLYAISKNDVETEEELRACLQFLNDIAGDEGFKLFTYGIEGKHYEVDGEGVIKTIDDTVWKQEVQALSSSRVNELLSFGFKSANEIQNLSNELILQNEEFAVYDVSRELTSDTYNEMWSQLLDIPKDAYYQYVMGKISMDDVKAANEKWLSQGGQKIIDEFTADYQRIYG